MGLDMWLVMKSKKVEEKETTGVCGGLFGIAPKFENGFFEIGYWRKAYDQQDLIWQYAKSDNTKEAITNGEIDFEGAKAILKEAKIKCKEKISDDNSEYGTFNNHQKWKDTVKFFTIAVKIFEEDPKAKLYYHEWF